ncbi:MAG: hypothetical protein JXR37_18550 [Kiritimatiellae bacterium]|nr:hypothetical protein [Kiritimatiellia bacterium]
MNGRDDHNVDLRALQAILGNSLLWVVAALVVLVVFLVTTIRFGQIMPQEVGIQLNRISGEIEVIHEPGMRIYNGIISDLYVLDKTLQTLEMRSTGQTGDQETGDHLKIKTVDGSDVNVDLKVQYGMNPEMAQEVILGSGPENAYKEKWARDYVRGICRNHLGELTTEEFYDANKRNEKVQNAQKQANGQLNPHGIFIDHIVIPRKPRFYGEYEEMIRKKKLADQETLQEQSKALAAKQHQIHLIVQETNKLMVAVEQFEGQMRQRIIATEAEGERIKRAADAYYEQATVGAKATYYRMKLSAEGILARKKAEAQGIEELKKALEGEGGRNMVKYEYAKKLKDIRITGKPVAIQGTIERFEHLKGAAAATGRE